MVVKQKQHPNPLLDVPMSYLQTNTRLENLEVVERVGITLHHDWHYGRKKMAFYMSPNFQLSLQVLLDLFMYIKLLTFETPLRIKGRK